MTFQEKIAKAFRLRTYTGNRLLRGILSERADKREQRLREQAARQIQQQSELAAKQIQDRRDLLTVENLRHGIDEEKLKSIQALSEVKDRPDVFWTKYLDVDHWLAVNIKHAQELGLADNPPADLLDLGCGAGYFLLVCRALGARVLGVDVKTDQVLNGMIELFGLERMTKRIKPMKKLPNFGRRFDLITGFMICFNFPTNETYWNASEWDFFLNDLLDYLKPGGRMFFSLNKQPDGELYSDALKAYFLGRGAVIKGKRILLNYDDLLRTRSQAMLAAA